MTCSTTRMMTDSSSRYLGQLCAHFAHKLPVSQDGTLGTIEFSTGHCTLSAQEDSLLLRLDSPDETSLVSLQDVVERHLVRFAFREPPTLVWARSAD